jgi:hypothetical protein
MKNTLLILASLAMTSGIASASIVFCSGVTSAAGNSTFVGATDVNGAGTASVDGSGNATLTCTGLGNVPAGMVLSSINIGDRDDAQGPTDGSSGINWTWTMNGGPAVTSTVVTTVNNEVANDPSAFGNCSTTTAGSPAIGCDTQIAPNLFNLLSPLGPGSAIPNLSFLVTSAAVNGDGVFVTGTTSADLYIQLNFTPNTATPEPTTFGLVGGALLGLGLLRKKVATGR